ncbi:unnamed protein product [Caenorhabditis angaria]|uniref:Sdz-33 F-box domain-containing protein n=1 Tax=Caenorhabditis angaria TaxID=860376 RepID=A0A9P1IZ46_9PELO|nr:unnamed protein product [Caenorhabditis angaria]
MFAEISHINEIVWEVKEDGKLFDVIAKYANEYIEKFGKNLKRFEVELGCKAKSHLIRKIRLRNMRKLEELTIYGTPRQVCMLKYKFVDFDQIKCVKSNLVLPATVLSFDQLIQLKAESISIYMMDLTPKDINQYIKYWRDGKLNANLKYVVIQGGFSEKNKKRKDVEVDLDGLELEKCQDSYFKKQYILNYNKTQKARLELDDKSSSSCGCAAPPTCAPPPRCAPIATCYQPACSSCAGKRKKREVLSNATYLADHDCSRMPRVKRQGNLEVNKCNSEELRKIIENKIDRVTAIAKRRIQEEAERVMGGR